MMRCVLVQGKAPKTVMANIIDSIAAGMQADIPQLASDFQMGPANSVSFSEGIAVLTGMSLAGSVRASCNARNEQRVTCFLPCKYHFSR